jgi:hypothetical protein
MTQHFWRSWPAAEINGLYFVRAARDPLSHFLLHISLCLSYSTTAAQTAHPHRRHRPGHHARSPVRSHGPLAGRPTPPCHHWLFHRKWRNNCMHWTEDKFHIFMGYEFVQNFKRIHKRKETLEADLELIRFGVMDTSDCSKNGKSSYRIFS